MADIATRYRNQLGSFRIKHLKDTLTRLGLPKQGTKQILIDKIMGLINPAEKQPTKGSKSSKIIVSREEATAIIDEEYRKLRHSRTESKKKAAKSGVGSGYPSARPEEFVCGEEAKTRCPCGNNTKTGAMVQCSDLKCQVWQHMSCVVIPEKPADGTQAGTSPNFYCDLCRISRSDPFCQAQTQSLMPSKLVPSGANAEGSNIVHILEKSFYLSRADRNLLQKPNYELQVWCVLFSDSVLFRMHWPCFADLRVNGISVRVTNRPGQQLLGANGRDEGPSVMEIIPNEKEGEPVEEAMARVRRCFNGGVRQGFGADDDSDSDLEVVADFNTVNLRCPMSGSRIKVAGRFKPCLHMGCFDLDTFVKLNQQSRKWQCPICLKNYSIENLIIDPFFNRITNAVKLLDEDITAVELKSDGVWRPKLEGSVRNREPWRPSPVKNDILNGTTPVLVLFSQNADSEATLSSHDNNSSRLNQDSCGNLALHCTENSNDGHSQEVIIVSRQSRSNSATDENSEGNEDERSVNQDRSAVCSDDGDNVGLSARPSEPTGKTRQPRDDNLAFAAEVIVLSDSDDEGENEGAIVPTFGASMPAEANVVGIESRCSRKSNHTSGDSLGLAVGLENANVTIASHSGRHPLVHATSSRVDSVSSGSMTDHSEPGLEFDSSSLSAVPAEMARNEESDAHESQTEVGNVPVRPPVRQTQVQTLVDTGSSSTPLDRDITSSPSGLGSLSLSNRAIATDGSNVDSDDPSLPQQKTLPAQPVRAEVLLAEENHALEEATHRTLLLQLSCTS